jgi:peptidoglycan hydrolase CwlO-like protein
MYNNRKPGTPIKNFLLFGFMTWTIWLGFIWFANQGEMVTINTKYISTQYKLDSIKQNQSDYREEIDLLKEKIDHLEQVIDNKNHDVMHWSRLYSKEKSKNDTTIKITANE